QRGRRRRAVGRGRHAGQGLGERGGKAWRGRGGCCAGGLAVLRVLRAGRDGLQSIAAGGTLVRQRSGAVGGLGLRRIRAVGGAGLASGAAAESGAPAGAASAGGGGGLACSVRNWAKLGPPAGFAAWAGWMGGGAGGSAAGLGAMVCASMAQVSDIARAAQMRA